MDDGGASAASPSYSGQQTLNIEPSAIPQALAAFRTAHQRVARKVDELSQLEVPPWAHDEVSAETATRFEHRSTGGGNSAMACLTGYRDQLARTCDTLEAAQRAYTLMEGENSALWGKY